LGICKPDYYYPKFRYYLYNTTDFKNIPKFFEVIDAPFEIKRRWFIHILLIMEERSYFFSYLNSPVSFKVNLVLTLNLAAG
jgi:hypothetical protein